MAFARPVSAPAQSPVDSSRNVGLKDVALSAGLFAGFMFTIDGPIAQSAHGAASPGTLNTARQFDRLGDPTGLLPIIGGIALTGLITHRSAVMRVALRSAESVVLASAVAQVGKYAVGRVRPNADPDLDALDFLMVSSSPSFPSGHTAAAFALATALGDGVDKTWARVGFYALASGTGWARIAEEQHWLSDVVAGAAVGILSARFVDGRTRIFGIRPPHLIVEPHTAALGWTF